LWQAAARDEGAAGGRGEAASGLAGFANGCCADAADEKARAAQMIAIAARIADDGLGIDSPGVRADLRASGISQNPVQWEILFAFSPAANVGTGVRKDHVQTASLDAMTYEPICY
jgi:hypothetical protein